MNEGENGGVKWWLRNHEERLHKLERIPPATAVLEERLGRIGDVPSKVGVLEERVANLSDDVKSLKRAFYTFAFSVVGGAVIFAFSVFELVGNG